MSFQKIISLALALLFVLFAYFQINDPDPQYWIAVYGLTAAACFSVFLERSPRYYVFLVMAAAYLIAAFNQWPAEYEGILFGEMKMRNLNIELARESLGLVICALSMLLMGWFVKPR
jgi:Transmembrane family 220, helix